MRLQPIVLVFVTCACAHSQRADRVERRDLWVPYVHRGVLYRVRADGSGRARLRDRTPRPAPASEPDAKLFDLWRDPAPRPAAETIAVVRGRNLSFHVHPAAPSDFDQSWELVLVEPGNEDDRVVYRSGTELRGPRWSGDGRRLLARVGRRGLVVWDGERCAVYAVKGARLMLACFGRDAGTVDVVMDSYLIGTAKLQSDALQVKTLHGFQGHRVPKAIRDTEPVHRLFGRAGPASVLGPPFLVTADGRFSFFFRKKEGFLPRGWIEGRDARTGATFEVTTLWRGLYAE